MLTIATILLVVVLIWFATVLGRGAYTSSDTNRELAGWLVGAAYTLSSAGLVAYLGVKAGVIG